MNFCKQLLLIAAVVITLSACTTNEDALVGSSASTPAITQTPLQGVHHNLTAEPRHRKL